MYENIPNNYYRDKNGKVKLKPEFEEPKTEETTNAALANQSILSGAEQEALKSMNDAEIKQFGKKLSYKALIDMIANPNTPAAVRLGCCKELIDRDEGKPAQTVAMSVETKGIDKLTTDRLLALERHLAELTGVNALVIPPPPKKLVDYEE